MKKGFLLLLVFIFGFGLLVAGCSSGGGGGGTVVPSATATSSASASATATHTASPSATATHTATASASATATNTPGASSTSTSTPTPTPSPTPTPTPTPTPSPTPTYVVSGKVRFYSEIGEGITGVTVSIEGNSSDTNSSGDFSISGITPGTHTIYASKQYGWDATSETISVSGATTETLYLHPTSWEVLNLDGDLKTITLASVTYGYGTFEALMFASANNNKVYKATISNPSTWLEVHTDTLSGSFVTKIFYAGDLGMLACDISARLYSLTGEAFDWVYLGRATDESIVDVDFWSLGTGEVITADNRVIQMQLDLENPSNNIYTNCGSPYDGSSALRRSFHFGNTLEPIKVIADDAKSYAYIGSLNWFPLYGNQGNDKLSEVAAGNDLLGCVILDNMDDIFLSSGAGPWGAPGSIYLSRDSAFNWSIDLKDVPYVLKALGKNNTPGSLQGVLVAGGNGLVMRHK